MHVLVSGFRMYMYMYSICAVILCSAQRNILTNDSLSLSLSFSLFLSFLPLSSLLRVVLA